MTKEETKTIWKLAKITWISGSVFWAIENILFLIIEGWHFSATNPIEVYCDKLSSTLWTFALYLTIYSGAYALIGLNKKDNE